MTLKNPILDLKWEAVLGGTTVIRISFQKEPWSNCKGGFRKYKNACYRLARGNHDGNFRDIETM